MVFHGLLLIFLMLFSFEVPSPFCLKTSLINLVLRQVSLFFGSALSSLFTLPLSLALLSILSHLLRECVLAALTLTPHSFEDGLR